MQRTYCVICSNQFSNSGPGRYWASIQYYSIAFPKKDNFLFDLVSVTFWGIKATKCGVIERFVSECKYWDLRTYANLYNLDFRYIQRSYIQINHDFQFWLEEQKETEASLFVCCYMYIFNVLVYLQVIPMLLEHTNLGKNGVMLSRVFDVFV